MRKEYKDYNELSFTDDFMFWKVLTTNEKLCKHLLELILRIKIRKIVYQEQQKDIQITADGRGIRLDIYVEDEKNTVYNLEMQTTSNKNLPKRTRYYQGMLDLNLIERGADFSELKKCYVIFICTFDPFEKGLPVYTFKNICKELPELELGDETTKVFINGSSTELSGELGNFIRFLSNGKGTDEFTKALEDSVEKVKAHDEWRNDYMTLMMRDKQNIEKGRLIMLFDMVKDGTITLSVAVKKAGMAEEELKEAWRNLDREL